MSTTLFAAPSSFPVGTFPNAIVAGAFEGTAGPTDLAVGDLGLYNAGDAGIMLLFANADGGFRDGGNFDHMNHTPGFASLATGDFNNDGTVDVAFAGFTGSQPGVGILLSQSAGGFSQSVAYASSSSAALLAAGYFEGSGGPLDLAWGGSNEMHVLHNQGGGSFSLFTSFDAGDVSGLASGDYSGHGFVEDLVTGSNSLHKVSVLTGTGAGTFNFGNSVGVGFYPNFLLPGDFNQDGKLDVVAVDEGAGSVFEVLGTGSGTFQTPASSYSAGGSPDWIASADFNGDHVPDLAVADTAGLQAAVLLGNGDGTFRDGGLLVLPEASGKAGALAAGDFNGDGKPDLAVTNSNGLGTVDVFINTGCPAP